MLMVKYFGLFEQLFMIFLIFFEIIWVNLNFYKKNSFFAPTRSGPPLTRPTLLTCPTHGPKTDYNRTFSNSIYPNSYHLIRQPILTHWTAQVWTRPPRPGPSLKHYSYGVLQKISRALRLYLEFESLNGQLKSWTWSSYWNIFVDKFYIFFEFFAIF
jgi:hypothetical protein